MTATREALRGDLDHISDCEWCNNAWTGLRVEMGRLWAMEGALGGAEATALMALRDVAAEELADRRDWPPIYGENIEEAVRAATP